MTAMLLLLLLLIFVPVLALSLIVLQSPAFMLVLLSRWLVLVLVPALLILILRLPCALQCSWMRGRRRRGVPAIGVPVSVPVPIISPFLLHPCARTLIVPLELLVEPLSRSTSIHVDILRASRLNIPIRCTTEHAVTYHGPRHSRCGSCRGSCRDVPTDCTAEGVKRRTG